MLCQVQELCVLSTLLGDAMIAAEKETCVVKQQAWHTLMIDIERAPSIEWLQRKMQQALALGSGPSLRHVYGFALKELNTPFAPCAEI